MSTDVVLATVYEDLFKNPSIERMWQLEPWQFEEFVAHVFTAAGYTAEIVADQHFPIGSGVDVNLYHGPARGKPLARVEVRKYQANNPLDLNAVTSFLGKLQLAGGVPGFLVTTSDFTSGAYQAAQASNGKVTPVNGSRLLRYIAYVGGSRSTGTYAGLPTSPFAPTSPAVLFQAEQIAQLYRRPPRHTRVLAVGNNKGGVAKTTTALNVAFALAEQHGQRVLLVDMDGQASLTRSLPRPGDKNAPPPLDQVHLASYFEGRATPLELVRPTRFANLYLVPSHPDMRRLDTFGSARPDAELRFVEDLHKLALPTPGGDLVPFDWVVIDTPPAQSFFTRVSLAAADYLLIPAYAETYASQGIEGVLSTARTMRALMGGLDAWEHQVLGCLITRWKPSKAATDNLGLMRAQLDSRGIPLFLQAIPLDDKIEQAHQSTSQGGVKHIFKIANRPGPAARAYDDFVKEMLSHVYRREA